MECVSERDGFVKKNTMPSTDNTRERAVKDLDFPVGPKVNPKGKIAQCVRVVSDKGSRKIDVLEPESLLAQEGSLDGEKDDLWKKKVSQKQSPPPPLTCAFKDAIWAVLLANINNRLRRTDALL